MMLRRSIRRDAMVVGATLLALAVGGFLFAWSGLYNIAASKGHWAIVEWMLRFGMSNSVELRAAMIDAPHLDRTDLVVVGANHYRTGCAYCHGAPGVKASPISQNSLPPPPDLTTVSDRWNDSELFWIVKNGIKYTGMPAWASQKRDDEVWAVVAFLKKLSGLSPDAYLRLQLPASVNASSGVERDAAVNCGGCHGDTESGPRSAFVPSLEGQTREYLIAALEDYASGARESGFMQPVASDLAPGAISALAAYYAGRPRRHTVVAVKAADAELGRLLATTGLPEAGLPACDSCHAGDALPSYPRLWGQSAAYMAGQLQLWKQGLRAGEGRSAIMAPIAQRLSDQQIAAVSAFYAATPAAEARR